MTIFESFLKNKKVQKTLQAKPGEEGFSLVELVVVIAVLAILSAVAVPAFVGVQANARASAVKNGLANMVKECVVRDTDEDTTAFADAQATQGNYNGYTMAAWSGTYGLSDSCYSAKATPVTSKAATEAWFTIEMNTATGQIRKTCQAKGRPGCKGGTSSAPEW